MVAADELVPIELDELAIELVKLLDELLTGATELTEDSLLTGVQTLPVIAGRSAELLFLAT